MTSVAYVTTTFPTLAAFIESEVHRLHARGVRVRVFTLGPVGRQCQPEHRALLPLTESLGSPWHPAGWLALLGWLVRRPHVLIPEVTRMLWVSRTSGYALAGHLGYLPAAARVANALERESFERVHGAWAHFPASVAYLAARLAGVPFSMAAHAGADLYRTQAFLKEKVRAATFVAGCVRGNVEMLRALAGPTARIEWLYHGVDLLRFDGAARQRAPEARLLTVGRLAPTKGFDEAIRTVAALRARGADPHLTLVGDGPEREALERLARELGVAERVEFAGALTHEALLPLYRRAWMLLAPCKELGGRRDGIPNVVVEAMAMGVPVAGTRAAGLDEIVADGETGTLTAPGDADAMAAALAPLLQDPARLDAMGRNARARVVRDFDAAVNFERLEALFGLSSRAAGAPAARAEAVTS